MSVENSDRAVVFASLPFEPERVVTAMAPKRAVVTAIVRSGVFVPQ